jgi:hypothetical protein
MISPTLWAARRVEDVILCGRKVGGRYVCQGELATIDRQQGREWVRLPRGMFAEPGTQPEHWRPTERARRGKPDSGRRYLMGRERSRYWSFPALPLTRDCPHCQMRNTLTGDLLRVLE